MKVYIPKFDAFQINEATFKKEKQLDDDAHKKYQELKYKFLKKQLDVCKKHGVKCFADFGTLLGIVRDGDLIRNDNDTDLQIFGETLNSDFFEELQKVFFAVPSSKTAYKKLFNEEDDYAELMYIWLEDIDDKGKKITVKGSSGQTVGMFGDMMISYPYENKQRILRWPGWEVMTYDEKHASKIGTKSFKGFSVPIPASPEDYIEYFYGADWKTPQSRFGKYTCNFVDRKKAHKYMYSLKEGKFKIQ